MTVTDYENALLQASVDHAPQVVRDLQTAAHTTLAPFTPLKDPLYKLNYTLLLQAADLIRALAAQLHKEKTR